MAYDAQNTMIPLAFQIPTETTTFSRAIAINVYEAGLPMVYQMTLSQSYYPQQRTDKYEAQRFRLH